MNYSRKHVSLPFACLAILNSNSRNLGTIRITDSALMDYPSLHTFVILNEVVEKGQPIFPRLNVEMKSNTSI